MMHNTTTRKAAVTTLLLAILLTPISGAHAGDWRLGLGLTYVSGISDVADLYENNFNATNSFAFVESKLVIPVGIAFSADHHWESGVRADIGLGPVSLILGDAGDHSEVPLGITVGYTFFPQARTSPYIRAGLVHHFVSGDYYVSASPGLLGAVGIEFSRLSVAKFALEIAIDDSRVEFDNYTCTTGIGCRRSTIEMNTYDILVSLAAKF